MAAFEWDLPKAEENLRLGRIDFEDATRLFSGLMITTPVQREDESRYVSIGILEGETIVVVWTPREGAIRLVSVRKASRKERKHFNQEVRRSVGTGTN